MVTGGPITITGRDVAGVCRFAPDTQVIAVHLEAMNHCLETRGDLREALQKECLSHRVRVPANGETMSF